MSENNEVRSIGSHDKLWPAPKTLENTLFLKSFSKYKLHVISKLMHYDTAIDFYTYDNYVHVYNSNCNDNENLSCSQRVLVLEVSTDIFQIF